MNFQLPKISYFDKIEVFVNFWWQSTLIMNSSIKFLKLAKLDFNRNFH